MARIAGINIPTNKHIVIGLQHIYGVGSSSAGKICAAADINPANRVCVAMAGPGPEALSDPGFDGR